MSLVKNSHQASTLAKLGLSLLLGLPAGAWAAPFQTFSNDIHANEKIAQKFAFKGFGCTGDNVSPQIAWRHAPSGTKSFAIMVHDPDAPTGGAGFWHWVVINIPASVHSLPEGAGNPGHPGLPASAREIRNDYGMAAWGGPCPPAEDRPHRYVFTVYALKVEHLDPPANATASLTGFMINQNALAKSSFTAHYGR